MCCTQHAAAHNNAQTACSALMRRPVSACAPHREDTMGRSMRIHGWSSEAHGLKGILAFAPDSFGAPRQTIITIFAQQLLDAENADGCRLLGWVRKDWDTAISIVTMSATGRILHHLSSFPSQKSFPSQNSSFRAWRRSAAFRAALARKKHEKPASFRFPSA